jgi:uroporphyrinogen-III synthase
MRVIVTRAEPDGAAFADLCRAHGLDPVLAPVMLIEIGKATIDLTGAGALAFTSANGVRAFAANSARRDLPVFAVGPVTGEAARGAGFTDIRCAGGDVESLAAHIASESALAGAAVLHVAGEDHAGDLVALLAARAVAVRRRTLYTARPVEALSAAAAEALAAEPSAAELSAAWVSLFSPRTASLFIDLVTRAGLAERLGRCRAACLSAAVADAAGRARWAGLEVAPERSAESLVRLMAVRGRA